MPVAIAHGTVGELERIVGGGEKAARGERRGGDTADRRVLGGSGGICDGDRSGFLEARGSLGFARVRVWIAIALRHSLWEKKMRSLSVWQHLEREREVFEGGLS